MRFSSDLACLFPDSGVIAMELYVYAVGGYDSTCQLRSVECYSLEKDCWEFVAPMISPRSALSVAVICNRLYALGKQLRLIPSVMVVFRVYFLFACLLFCGGTFVFWLLFGCFCLCVGWGDFVSSSVIN